jgi:hypothetical protein
MKKKDLPKELKNNRGNVIPVENIRTDLIKKHLLVNDIFDIANALQDRMEKEKAKIYKKIQAYEKWIAKKNGVEDAAFENLNLSNYDGSICISIYNNSVVEFDEKIQLAKQKIDKCISRWGAGAPGEIKILIDKFFKVGKKGLLNKQAIFSLFQLKIEDPEWLDAMKIIQDSITDSAKKEYLVIKHRNTNKDEWQNLNLNFSSLDYADNNRIE